MFVCLLSFLSFLYNSLQHDKVRLHLQDVVQSLGAKGLACVEQRVGRLVHLMLLPPRGLGVPHQSPLQGFAAALKLLAHVFEATDISTAKKDVKETDECSRVKLGETNVLFVHLIRNLLAQTVSPHPH